MDCYNSYDSFGVIESFIINLRTEIENIEKSISKYPDGKLYLINNNKYSNFRITTSSKKTIELINKNKWNIIYDKTSNKKRRVTAYLPKENLDFATCLVRREMLEKRLGVLAEVLKDTERCFKLNYDDMIRALSNAASSKFLSDEFTKLEHEYVSWMNKKYNMNTMPKKYKYTAKNGWEVRSKSELFIANMLIDYKLPFLYEPVFPANGNVYYPDFVIINPLTRKIYIWEHNGNMNDFNYLYKVQLRLRDYSLEGFLLGDDLIFTNETLERPLKPEDVEESIHKIINDPGDRRNELWDFDKLDKVVHGSRE